jgi:hypothetical protein
MQAAKEYDMQFNNILKKEEYRKYNYAQVKISIGIRSNLLGD